MSNYVPLIVYKTTFQDDEVTATMEPLSRGAFMAMQHEMEKARVVDDPHQKNMAVYVQAVSVLTVSLKKIDGLRDTNGNAVSMETVLDKVFFMQLVNELFGEMMARSTLGKALSTVLEEKSPG
jgi:hypothetical protein